MDQRQANVEETLKAFDKSYDRFVEATHGPIIASSIRFMSRMHEADVEQAAKKKRDHKNELNRQSRARMKQRREDENLA